MKIGNSLITPYYVINKQELDNNFGNLVDALRENWNNYVIGYSYKTNALPWVINYFDSKGCYSEVVSNDEYELGKLMGIQKNKFIYNGPIKTKDSFVEAVSNGCYVNIDSRRELEWAKNLKGDYKIGLRVNFDVEKYCPDQSQCGDEGGRFGFCYENGEFAKALKYLEDSNIKISGLHLHVSSKTRSIDIYKTIAKMVNQLKKEYKLNLSYIDIGGGFFGGLSDKPQFSDYIKIVVDELKECFDPLKTTLIIEPGMSLIGSPISYVTSVIDVKDTTYNRFVITDGSRTNIDPLMKKSSYFKNFVYLNSDKSRIDKQVVCGYTCMENDRLFVERNGLELEVGDKIVYDKVGAYTMCLTPLFIKYFSDVYLLNDGKYIKIRDKWTAEEYVQKSMLKEVK